MKKAKLSRVEGAMEQINHPDTLNDQVLHTKEKVLENARTLGDGRSTSSLRKVREIPTRMRRIVTPPGQVVTHHAQTPCLKDLVRRPTLAKKAMTQETIKIPQISASTNTQYRLQSISPRSSLPSLRESWTTSLYTDLNLKRRSTSRNGRVRTNSQSAEVEPSSKPTLCNSVSE